MEYLKQLRQATRSRHDQLEALPMMQFLEPNHWSIANYAQLISAFYWVYHATQSMWQSRLPLHYRERMQQRMQQRLQALEADMALCSHQAECKSFLDMPVLDCKDAYGFLYVIEGSSKGSKLIANVLAKRNVIADNGACYFNLYGQSVISDWRRFEDDFNVYVADDASYQRVLETALSTFDYFIERFTQVGSAYGIQSAV